MTELSLIASNQGEAFARGEPAWDLDIDIIDGQARTRTDGTDALKVRAYIACYTKLGTLPLSPEDGIDWTGLQKGNIPFTTVIASINQRLNDLIGPAKFTPDLRQEGQKLVFGLIKMNG